LVCLKSSAIHFFYVLRLLRNFRLIYWSGQCLLIAIRVCCEDFIYALSFCFSQI
jgi:hypothetical protein